MPERDTTPDRRIRDLEVQLDRLVTDKSKLQVDLAGTEQQLTQLRKVNEQLLADRSVLQERVDKLATERTELPIARVGDQLKAALVELGRTPSPEDDAPLDYVARSVRFDLKANLGFDADGGPVLRFPVIGEKVEAHELASIHLEFDATPRPDIDLSALVPVPHVVGLSEAAAGERLQAAGLVVGARSERESLATAGTVVGQDPPRGAYADPDTPVDLAVAVSARIEVPDVVGRPQAEAATVLLAAGFEVPTPTTTSRDDRPAGEVVEQRPTGGTRSTVGAAVELTVVVATPRIEVPALRGLMLAKADAVIEASGLRRGTVGRLRSDEPPGTVLRQDPAAGSAVAPGTEVELVVAEPGIERSVATPDVVGVRRDDATSALLAEGWGVRRLRAAEPDPAEARKAGTFGTVAAQDPPAGQPVPVSRKLVTLHVIGSPDPVTDVKGIGPAMADRLATGGVRTVGDLACLPVEELEELLGTGADRARDLIAAAQRLDDAYALLDIEGLEPELAVLLVRAGIRNRPQLADADPAALGRQLRQLAEVHPPATELKLTAAALRVAVEAAGRRPRR
jgi:eukaryotic-like serine/threonine-protein kinase